MEDTLSLYVKPEPKNGLLTYLSTGISSENFDFKSKSLLKEKEIRYNTINTSDHIIIIINNVQVNIF